MISNVERDQVDLDAIDWLTELPRLGLDAMYTERPGKSRPCPLHPRPGSTKFRFLRPYDRGKAVCNDCGILTGPMLARQINGWTWAELFSALRHGGAPTRRAIVACETPQQAVAREEKERANIQKMRKWWIASKAIGAQHSHARTFLETRVPHLDVKDLGSDLRAHPGLSYFEELEAGRIQRSQWPALLALFRDETGRVRYMHRIYVARDGTGKAPVDSPRKMYVPGAWVPGCAVRIGAADTEGLTRVIGVAEGVEKSCAIYTACGGKFPVWAAGSADNMAALKLPAEVEVVHIFADHNLPSKGHPGGHSQEKAEALRQRLLAEGKRVTVHIANTEGGDHEDDWLAMCSAERTV